MINKHSIKEFLNNNNLSDLIPKFVKQYLIYKTNYTHSFYRQIIYDFDIPMLKKDILKVSMDELSNIKILFNNLKISKTYSREIIYTLKLKNKLNKSRKSYSLNKFLVTIGVI